VYGATSQPGMRAWVQAAAFSVRQVAVVAGGRIAVVVACVGVVLCARVRNCACGGGSSVSSGRREAALRSHRVTHHMPRSCPQRHPRQDNASREPVYVVFMSCAGGVI